MQDWQVYIFIMGAGLLFSVYLIFMVFMTVSLMRVNDL